MSSVSFRCVHWTPFFLAGVLSIACSGGTSKSPSGGGDGDGDSSTGGASMVTGGSGGTSTGGAPSGGSDPGTGGVATGGTSTGGTPSVGPCQAHAVDPAFTLRWEDNFDGFNAERWEQMDHTFPENVAQFSPSNVVTEDGYLKLRFTQEATGEKSYRGGEVKSIEEFTYGRFDTCARWGKGGGLVASFFTYKFGPWNEIDIEYLGGNPMGIQYNIIWGEGPMYDPQYDPLEFDPADDFHHYAIEWTPGEVRSYMDGELRHTETGTSAQAIVEATTLRMNIWASDTGFAGQFDPNLAPTESWYDWVRVYDYQP